MNLDHRIRAAETRLFERHSLQPQESYLDLAPAGVRLRVLSVGAGPSPLSLLTVPVLGEATLRSPTPRPVYRKLLGQGLSPAAAAAAPT